VIYFFPTGWEKQITVIKNPVSTGIKKVAMQIPAWYWNKGTLVWYQNALVPDQMPDAQILIPVASASMPMPNYEFLHSII
jgi:hypothetical protein